MKLSRIDIIGSNGNNGEHYADASTNYHTEETGIPANAHRCHNRPEFPETTTAQDGWQEYDLNTPGGELSRFPVLRKIPFTMSKMSDGCKQWQPPFGAVIKGIMAESGCDGCRWRHDAAE